MEFIVYIVTRIVLLICPGRDHLCYRRTRRKISDSSDIW